MNDEKVLIGALIPAKDDKSIVEHSLKITKTKPSAQAQNTTIKASEKK